MQQLSRKLRINSKKLRLSTCMSLIDCDLDRNEQSQQTYCSITRMKDKFTKKIQIGLKDEMMNIKDLHVLEMALHQILEF